ncbi:MAG: hypothetical protein OEY81_07625 [Candidatus Bathyarchaeota archaeon]|nr:hypothetical protein [Candidatus Bathyarchaeota archaeon]
MGWDRIIDKDVKKGKSTFDDRSFGIVRKFEPVKALDAGQKMTPISFDVRKAMLEAERRKAEAFNVLRLRERFS